MAKSSAGAVESPTPALTGRKVGDPIEYRPRTIARLHETFERLQNIRD